MTWCECDVTLQLDILWISQLLSSLYCNYIFIHKLRFFHMHIHTTLNQIKPKPFPSMSISCNLNPITLPMFSSKVSTPRSSNMISCKASASSSMGMNHRVSGAENLYQVLSLDQSDNVGFEDIKKAYRSMARKYHPDVVPASRKEESTRRFVELQKAYDTLSDPIRRQRYDYELGAGHLSSSGLNSNINFDRQVWEDQIRGLEVRDLERKQRKRRAYV